MAELHARGVAAVLAADAQTQIGAGLAAIMGSHLDQLEKAIVEYIDYYNNRRIKLKLNGLSPVQYRIQTVGTA